MLAKNSSILRLIDFDISDDFNIIVTIECNEKHYGEKIIVSNVSKIIIKTTINKARVISQNINQSYLNDQTIKQYVFKLNNMTTTNEIDKIIQIFHLLLNSIGKEIVISPDIQDVFNLILDQLSESNQRVNDIVNFNQKQIEIISYYRKINRKEVNGISRIKITAGNNNDIEYRYNVDNSFKYNTVDINDFYYKFNQHKISNDLFKKNERYIEFDFKDDRVKIETFKIQTNDFYHYAKSLKIVGSNDGQTWEELVTCHDNTKLKNLNDDKHTIILQNNNPLKYYQCIRYIEIDEANQNLNGCKFMKIESFEFIGDIFTKYDTNENNSDNKNDDSLDYSDLFMAE